MANQQGGFIRMIILIIIVLAILSYFNFNVRSFIESDMVQKNFGYVWDWVQRIWNNYLAAPFAYLWRVWVEYIWDAFIDALQKFKGGSMNPLIKNQTSMILQMWAC